MSGPPLVSAVNLPTPVVLGNGLATDIAVEAAALTENKPKKDFVISNFVDLETIDNFTLSFSHIFSHKFAGPIW